MKMIGISHFSSFNLACNCRPDMFGIRISTIRHAARVCKSDSRNSSADPKHRATSPAASIRSCSESCMAPSSSMIAINLVISRVRSVRSWFPHCLRSIRVCPLSRDPFTDIGQAVSEFGSVRFADRQEFYGLAVHEKDILEIDGHCAPFLFQQGTKHVHILRCNPSADAQDHKVLSDNMAVDSAAHCRFTFEPFYS